MGGVCPECGLGFVWRDVFRPELVTPWWSFEHAASGRFLALIVQGVSTLRPRAYWRRMRLEMPVVPDRLLAAAIASIVGLVAWTIALSGVSYVLMMAKIAGTATVWSGLKRSPLEFLGYAVEERKPAVYATAFVCVWMLLSAATALVLRQSFRKARVRHVHLTRCTVSMFLLAPGVVVLLGIALTLAWEWATSLGGLVLAPLMLIRACSPLLLAAWLFWWWRNFMVHYAKIPHGAGVALAQVIVGFLGALVASIVVASTTTF